jgi:enediyne biosynthesis protein E4
LAGATGIDSVEVRWPSGKIEHLSGLKADVFYRIVEGSSVAIPVNR